MRQMIATTSAFSGLINSRSASVFDDALCSSGTSSPVLARRFERGCDG
jgi:hypothetical protein